MYIHTYTLYNCTVTGCRLMKNKANTYTISMSLNKKPAGSGSKRQRPATHSVSPRGPACASPYTAPCSLSLHIVVTWSSSHSHVNIHPFKWRQVTPEHIRDGLQPNICSPIVTLFNIIKCSPIKWSIFILTTAVLSLPKWECFENLLQNTLIIWMHQLHDIKHNILMREDCQ